MRKLAAMESISIAGTRISPQRCKPAENIWNFKQTEQKRSIYVSHLSPNIDKIALRKAFSKFGKIIEIRLTIRKSIAFAYIDFELEVCIFKVGISSC